MYEPLPRDFYTTDALTLARALLGKTLVHRWANGYLAGMITETEAYMGVTDRASHAYGGRRTKRTETMYLPGGFAYVYLIYGMYHCMNITASVRDNPEAVLLRAVQPCGDREALYSQFCRSSRRRSLPEHPDRLTEAEWYRLTNRPGVLSNALAIDRTLDRADLCTESGGIPDLFVCDEGYVPAEVIAAPRIGIDYAGEAAAYPWRFTVGCVQGIPVWK